MNSITLRKSRKMNRNSLCIILMCIIIGICMAGCTKGEKREVEIYGGDILKYGLCYYSTMDYQQSFAIPIISTKKIKSFQFKSLDVTGEGEYSVQCSDLYFEQSYNYKGWNVYWCVLQLGIEDYKKRADFLIDAINFVINDRELKYKTPYFHIANTKGYNENIVEDGNDNMLFSGDADLIYPRIPNDKDNPVHTNVSILENLKICDFCAFDFLNITNMKVMLSNDNGEVKDEFTKEQVVDYLFKKNANATFTYNLNYKQGIRKFDIVKTSKIILYKNQKKELCMFADNTGFFINNSENDKNIKEYIEALLVNK